MKYAYLTKITPSASNDSVPFLCCCSFIGEIKISRLYAGIAYFFACEGGT